jgi:tetratricopeptide (TPR) repeat protein
LPNVAWQTITVDFLRAEGLPVPSAKVRIGASEYEISTPSNLAVEVQEDMRLLKWKGAGLSDPGDMLLVQIGTSLAGAIFPQENRTVWESLLAKAPKLLTLRFAPGTESLFQIPWELVCLENSFLLRSPDSHLVREWGTAGKLTPRPSGELSVLYVSFAVDDTIDYKEERSCISCSLRANIPVTFLPNPSRQELASVLRILCPSVVHVAAHGYFDELPGNHIILTGWKEPSRLEEMLEILSIGSPKLVILGTCEAGRLSTQVGGGEFEHVAPNDLAAYSYPVLNDTALEITRALYSVLGKGGSIVDAAARARGITSSDPYSFFNLVHYHKAGESYFLPEQRSGGRKDGIEVSLSIVGREKELHAIGESATHHQITTIISPVGYGGTTLVKAWAWLHERSPLTRSTYIWGTNAKDWAQFLGGLPQSRAEVPTYLVLDDEYGQLARMHLPKLHLIRVVPPAVYEPIPGENVLVLSRLGYEAAGRLAEARLGADARLERILQHDLGGVPGFIGFMSTDLAHSVQQGEEFIERANSMEVRFGRLDSDAIRVAGLLVATRGRMAVRMNEDEASEPVCLIPRDQFDRGVHILLAGKVAFRAGGEIILSSEFLDLGDKWFPHWGEENRELLRQLAFCLYTIAEGRRFSEEEANQVRSLFGWAAHIKDWQIAFLLLELLTTWFASRGRLQEIRAELATIKDNVDGLNRVIVSGNLGYILIHEGSYREALAIHQETEEWIRANPAVVEYHRNLASAITGQIDCYLALGMPADADRKITDAISVIDGWKGEMSEEGSSRVLAQIGNALSYSGRLEAAVRVFSKAIEIADRVGQSSLQTEARLALGLVLFKLERYDQAEGQINEGLTIIPSLEDAQEINAKYLDLKGQLLMVKKSPEAINYLLESYEIDRIRGDQKGITTSLLHLATWYFEHGQLGRAQSRLDEAETHVSKGGFVEDAGKIAHLRGKIYLASGDRSKAQFYFLRAARQEAAAGHLELAAEDNDLAAECGG